MRASRRTRRPRQGGFTLLEVIVALAILSVAVVAAIEGFAQGLRLLKLAGDHQRATLYADQKLREVVTPQEGREEEQDRDTGFTWERVTTRVEAPDLSGDGTHPALWRVWEIVVRVRFGERRQVEVATLRTTPLTQEELTFTTTGQIPAPGTRPGATPSTQSATGAAPSPSSSLARRPGVPPTSLPRPQ